MPHILFSNVPIEQQETVVGGENCTQVHETNQNHSYVYQSNCQNNSSNNNFVLQCGNLQACWERLLTLDLDLFLLNS